MRYQVRFVEDSELPSEVEYVFALLVDRTYLFMKQSALDTLAGECVALTRSFNTWERAQAAELKHLASA